MFPNAKNPYMENAVATASPQRLLVMLYDRLLLDLQRGRDAQRAGNLPEAHAQLVHAQEIVIHLRSTLRVDAWDGGPGLASLYDWLHTQLIKANVAKDAELTEGCLSVVLDLAEAWRTAALQSAPSAG